MYTIPKRAASKLSSIALPIAFIAILLTSCMSNDEEVSVGNNTCYISGVTFNSFRRQLTAKASDGVTDSTYYSTYTASKWTFTIDQKTLLIENRDSLPYNTDLSRVVMNMSYSGGLAYYRASDAWDDDPWISYQSTDSIDMRKPVHLRIVATDNTERRYTLKVNMHTMDSDSLKWATVSSEEAISGAHPMKATFWDDKISVLVNNGDAVLWLTHGKNGLGGWDKQVTDLPTGTNVTSLTKGQDAIYVSTEDGELYRSQDGAEWTMTDSRSGLRLVGATDDKLYAVFDGAIHSTCTDKMEWSAEDMDDDAALLPDREITFITYAQTERLTRMVIAGNRNVPEDTCAVVWSKCWTGFESEEAESWMYYTRTWDNTAPMPMLTQPVLMHYDNMLMLVGGQSYDGKIKAMERFYVSRDNGLSWWRLQTIIPPTELQGTDGYLTSAVDNDNFLWLIAHGKVYRGRINRLGFARPDIY
ncbi:MAG: hypothetical protein K2J00_07680 [Bacteroidaceae bacterium]|nr:hypothetical protein [Bacteroidaceae bacterium]